MCARVQVDDYALEPRIRSRERVVVVFCSFAGGLTFNGVSDTQTADETLQAKTSTSVGKTWRVSCSSDLRLSS